MRKILKNKERNEIK